MFEKIMGGLRARSARIAIERQNRAIVKQIGIMEEHRDYLRDAKNRLPKTPDSAEYTEQQRDAFNRLTKERYDAVNAILPHFAAVDDAATERLVLAYDIRWSLAVLANYLPGRKQRHGATQERKVAERCVDAYINLSVESFELIQNLLDPKSTTAMSTYYKKLGKLTAILAETDQNLTQLATAYNTDAIRDHFPFGDNYCDINGASLADALDRAKDIKTITVEPVMVNAVLQDSPKGKAH